MATETPMVAIVNVFVTYTLVNDHIFLNETGAADTVDIVRADELNIPTRSVDMVKIAGLNIPSCSPLYILDNPADDLSLNVTAGYFSSFDPDANTVTFELYSQPNPEDKKVVENIISNVKDYELFANLSVRTSLGSRHIKFNKRGESFFFLKNKKYIISKEIKLTANGLHKEFLLWKERKAR